MAAPKAPLLDQAGKKAKDVTLEADVFGAEIKPHLVHEQVRAELNAARQGTRGAKSRGMVAGGRAKPWRQKGTGRARAGTTRAAQWTGGGVVFPPGMRNFEVKVNRKARKAAFRAALSSHANAGTLALIDGSVFDKPSTKLGVALTKQWGQKTPLLIVATDAEDSLIKSFRNLPRTVVTLPSELEVSALVWANSVLVTEAALPVVQARAQSAKEASA
jgi:large subunit ribosomal protein L4